MKKRLSLGLLAGVLAVSAFVVTSCGGSLAKPNKGNSVDNITFNFDERNITLTKSMTSDEITAALVGDYGIGFYRNLDSTSYDIKYNNEYSAKTTNAYNGEKLYDIDENNKYELNTRAYIHKNNEVFALSDMNIGRSTSGYGSTKGTKEESKSKDNKYYRDATKNGVVDYELAIESDLHYDGEPIYASDYAIISEDEKKYEQAYSKYENRIGKVTDKSGDEKTIHFSVERLCDYMIFGRGVNGCFANNYYSSNVCVSLPNYSIFPEATTTKIVKEATTIKYEMTDKYLIVNIDVSTNLTYLQIIDENPSAYANVTNLKSYNEEFGIKDSYEKCELWFNYAGEKKGYDYLNVDISSNRSNTFKYGDENPKYFPTEIHDKTCTNEMKEKTQFTYAKINLKESEIESKKKEFISNAKKNNWLDKITWED